MAPRLPPAIVTIKNDGEEPDRLVSVSADFAGETQIHQMSMAGGVMKMRPVPEGIAIPPKSSVVLEPSGYHLMFMDFTAPLKWATASRPSSISSMEAAWTSRSRCWAWARKDRNRAKSHNSGSGACGPLVLALGLTRGTRSDTMLTALTTGLRFRLAIALAAFAALCFVAPPAVLAFGHGAHTADCLAHADMLDHGNVAAHDSKHPVGHSSPAGDHHMNCCGLFCLSALAVDNGEAVAPVLRLALPFPAREPSLLSRVQERPDRPPISHPIV